MTVRPFLIGDDVSTQALATKINELIDELAYCDICERVIEWDGHSELSHVKQELANARAEWSTRAYHYEDHIAELEAQVRNLSWGGDCR